LRRSLISTQRRRLELHISACRINGAPAWGQARCLGSWCVSQNFLLPQRDQPLLPVDMREWLPEDDLVFVVLAWPKVVMARK
jgi:hypothetical protein